MALENNNMEQGEPIDMNNNDEIALTTPPRPPRKKMKPSTVVCIVILVVCAVVAAICIFNLVKSFISAQKAKETYGKIESDVLDIILGDGTKDPSDSDSEPSATPVWTRPSSPQDTDEPHPDEGQSDTSEDTETREPADISTETDVVEAPTDTGEDSNTESSPTVSEPVDTVVTETETAVVTDTEKEPETVIPPSSTSSEIYQKMRSYLLSLQNFSLDLVGIVYIPIQYDGKDRTILYPFVLGEDNSFYLKRDIYGNDSKEGCIFADCSNDKNPFNNQNFVLYGHNMFGGSMFANLTYFLKYNVFHSQTYIYIYTVDAIYVYDPIAAYSTNESDDYTTIRFDQNNDIKSFLEEAQQKSADNSNGMFTKKYRFTNDDKAITLSTCFGGVGGRLAVHGVLVGVYQ